MSLAACQLVDDVGKEDASSPQSHIQSLRRSTERGTAPLCPRCTVERCATVHRQQPLCRSCHCVTFTSRFRQTLKRRCAVQPTDRVLVGWSGGLSSSVLCELMRDGTADRGKYRLLLSWDIVHVDCAAIRRPTSEEQRSVDEAERTQLLSRFHTNVHLVPLSAVFDIPANTLSASPAANRPPAFSADSPHRAARDQQLRELFRSVQPANHARLLSALLTHLLSYCCLSGGYSAVLTGESATHAATSVITALTKGQGRVAAAHTRMQRRLLGARWTYPLHDTSHTHIAYMFHYQRLSTLQSMAAIDITARTHPSQSSNSAPLSSSAAATLDSLSRSFIASLDSLFGHSVANVLRTVEKVDRPDDSTTLACCCWCGEALPPTQQFEAALSTHSNSQAKQLLEAAPSEAPSTPMLPPSSSSALTLLSSAADGSVTSSCYDCRRSFTLPLRTAAQCDIPDCIRLFDSTAYLAQQQQQQQATTSDTAESQYAAATVADGQSISPLRSGRAARHGGDSSSGVERPHHAHSHREKQSAEQMRAHIQRFLLDESAVEGERSRTQR